MAEIRNLTRNGETFYPLTHEKAVIGMEDFKDTITTQISQYQPIEITGDVTNAPDEEDITSDSNNLLKFKNRNNLYGLGKVILRRGSSFASQVTQANTIYVIQYNFDLDNARINIPNGAILLFEGGSLSNGTLVCADLYDVRLVYYQDISVILNSVTLEGNFIYKACDKDTIGGISVDNSSIEENELGQLTVKAGGIQNTHLNSNTVDNSSISLDSNNKISIKDGGITGAKLNSAIVNTDDLSIVNNKIQLANRGTTDGMGMIILRKDQAFASQLTQQNTIYVIRYNFTLTDNVTIPANCILEFKGGSVSGENTLTGNNTLLSGDIKCLVTIAGTFANNYLDITWFGAVGDDNTECVFIFRNVFDACVNSGIDMFVPEGVFAFQTVRFAPQGQFNAGEDTSKYLDCKNVTIYGIYKKSIIKSYNNGDVINIAWAKNLNLKNLTVTSGYTPTGNETWGANLISLIDVENITIEGCYCHDSFWHWQEDGNSYNGDGGDGITLQGEVFHNVKITNCEIYNCDRGLDVNIGRGDFTYNPNSGIYISNVLVTKCCFGLHYGHYDYQEDHPFDVQAGLSYIQMKCVNCLQSCAFAYPVGVKAYIQTIATETIEQRLLSGYGTSWYGDIPTTSIPKNIKSSYEGNITGAVNCNIEVNSSAKEINYGFLINPGGTRGTSNKYLFLNNVISLTLSENTTVVPVKDQASITDEARFKFYTSPDYTSPIDKSVFIFNNLQFNDYMMYETATNNNVFIVDGIITTRNIKVKTINADEFDSENRVGVIKSKNGFFCAKNKVSSEEHYLSFGILGGADDAEVIRLAFNGYGDICRPEFNTDIVNGDMSSRRAGGYFIPVRKTGEISSIFGNIPVYKGNTKGTTTQRPSNLTTVESGQFYYDTTLNKPIWWDGTKWVKADGTNADS